MSIEKEILVVDDEKEVLSVLEDYFEDLQADRVKFNLTCVEDGLDAFHALSDKKFDLVVVDISLPYLRGDVLARACREKKTPNAETPIVIISGDIRDREDNRGWFNHHGRHGRRAGGEREG